MGSGRLILGAAGALAPLAVVAAVAGVDRTGRPEHAREAPRAEPARALRSARLDESGMASLRTVRDAGTRQAGAVRAVLGPCQRKARRVPQRERAWELRNCAFRPLAGAGASGKLNGALMFTVIREVAAGRCRRLLSEYGATLAQFGFSAEATVRTNGAWVETRANALSTGRLATAVMAMAASGSWQRWCAPRAEGALAGPRA